MLSFKPKQTPADALLDKVFIALETGNPDAARLALAEKQDEVSDTELSNIKHLAQVKYGIRL